MINQGYGMKVTYRIKFDEQWYGHNNNNDFITVSNKNLAEGISHC